MNVRFRHWLPVSKNRLALEALLELIRVRLLRNAADFSTIARLFGKPQAESPVAIDSGQEHVAHEIGQAIRRAVRIAPFRCNCLTQAICGLYMLKRRRISCTLYLGVAPRSDLAREAHAWLRSGSVIILGDNRLDRYEAIFPFGIEPK